MDDIYETIKYIKEKFPSLKEINLLNNPMNHKSNPTQYAIFRNRMKDSLTQLETLDGAIIERANDEVGMILRSAEARPRQIEEKKASISSANASASAPSSSVPVKAAESVSYDSKTNVIIKKKAVIKTTIDNLSERILKSHSEGNRFITNDDL